MITRTSTILLEGLKDPANPNAWPEFDGRYRPVVMAVARRSGLSEADAEDAAQEILSAFAESYRQGHYQREKGHLRSFLRGIASHKLQDIRRRRHTERPLADLENGTRLLHQLQDPQTEALWDEEWSSALLRQCLEEVRREIAPRTFEAFEMVALKEWPAQRAADHLKVSLDVVYQSRHRVLARVRELLPKMEEIW